MIRRFLSLNRVKVHPVDNMKALSNKNMESSTCTTFKKMHDFKAKVEVERSDWKARRNTPKLKPKGGRELKKHEIEAVRYLHKKDADMFSALNLSKHYRVPIQAIHTILSVKSASLTTLQLRHALESMDPPQIKSSTFAQIIAKHEQHVETVLERVRKEHREMMGKGRQIGKKHRFLSE